MGAADPVQAGQRGVLQGEPDEAGQRAGRFGEAVQAFAGQIHLGDRIRCGQSRGQQSGQSEEPADGHAAIRGNGEIPSARSDRTGSRRFAGRRGRLTLLVTL
ncbi:hypothetical protein [Planobispora longispora]|uniref:Uncharacterized protein n=1 Tax=Planobispora longispora TaxID=28887 RepID=A0A8J3RWE0_9ACTN|nr:hypothetical protein [Planobispora longispora]GIH79423.1 hypothetical protein Plo01_58520 [Planobispora longispora]